MRRLVKFRRPEGRLGQWELSVPPVGRVFFRLSRLFAPPNCAFARLGRSAAKWGLLIALQGCTAGRSVSSPQEQEGANRRDIPSEVGELPQHPVADRAGRFEASIEGLSPPEIRTEAGYVRLIADLGTEQPLNCFVYEAPIEAGQAMTRLLRAAEMGIDFTRMDVRSVSIVGDAPLIVLHAHYRTTDEETPRNGLLKVALSARASHPVVCSHEEPRLLASFERIVGGFLESLVPKSDFARAGLAPSDVPLLSETWILSHAGRPVGFSEWRVAQLSGDKVHSLRVSATFLTDGDKLRTTDSVAAEASDDSGLFQGRYLDVIGTAPEIFLGLDRTSDSAESFSYRVQGRSRSRDIDLEFSAPTPLQTAYRSFLAFHQPETLPTTYLAYVAELAPEKPTSVRISVVSGGGAQIQRGNELQSIQLGADGFPQRVGDEGQARLVRRRIFPQAAPPSLP